jgi:hypothetical protein
MTTTHPVTVHPATAHRRRNRVLTTAAIDLLDALHTHLSTFKLPELSSVNALTARDGGIVSVHLACHPLSEIACGLLAWADTLTETTAEAWRVPSGDSVHPSVIGQLLEGISVHVSSGVTFTEQGIGADLAPGASTTVPLAVPRERATPAEVTL